MEQHLHHAFPGTPAGHDLRRGSAGDIAVPAGEIVAIPPYGLEGQLILPTDAQAVVIFAHGSGSSRHSPRNRYVASALVHAGLGTLLFDLLTPAEADDRAAVFDIGLLAGRLAGAVQWLRRRLRPAPVAFGLFGASTGAAAALVAAARLPDEVAAVVSRGGRPDLAGDALPLVRAPTLFLVGGDDREVLVLNRRAMGRMTCHTALKVIPEATHLFEEPGALDQVIDCALFWFRQHLLRHDVDHVQG